VRKTRENPGLQVLLFFFWVLDWGFWVTKTEGKTKKTPEKEVIYVKNFWLFFVGNTSMTYFKNWCVCGVEITNSPFKMSQKCHTKLWRLLIAPNV